MEEQGRQRGELRGETRAWILLLVPPSPAHSAVQVVTTSPQTIFPTDSLCCWSSCYSRKPRSLFLVATHLKAFCDISLISEYIWTSHLAILAPMAWPQTPFPGTSSSSLQLSTHPQDWGADCWQAYSPFPACGSHWAVAPGMPLWPCGILPTSCWCLFCGAYSSSSVYYYCVMGWFSLCKPLKGLWAHSSFFYFLFFISFPFVTSAFHRGGAQ